MKKFFVLVFAIFIFSAEVSAQRFVKTFNTIADMLASSPNDANTNAMVLGYWTPYDGGGGNFSYYGSRTTTTNQGAVLKPNNFNGRWLANFTDAGGAIDVKRFGAKGDGTTDDTAALQSAIDFAEAQVPVVGLIFPAGNYLFSTLLVKSAALDGIHQENLHTLGSPQMGARLTQKIGAANHGIIVRANHLSAVRISNLAIVGNREDNQKNPFTITSASTRTNFVVNAGSGTWPTAPASPSTWPYYGYCFFFTSENKYAGAGLVVNRNTGTGAIDLMPFSDTYATVTNNSYLLSAGWKVCFAEVTTETSGYKTTTGIDSSLAGYNAIHIESDSVNKLVTRLQLKNLSIWHWHTGIRMGNTLANTIKDVWIGTASFAGIAGAFPGDNRDDFLDNVFIQGYWLRSNNTIPENLVLENKSFRKTLWGYYGLTSSGNMEMTTLDNTVNGLFVKDCLESKVGALHIDGPMQNGIWFGGGLTDVDRAQTTFASVVMRNINLASDLLVGPAALNPYYAINIFGSANSAVINELDVTKFGANNRYYNAAFHAPIANGVHVNNLYTVAGATNMFSTGTTHHPSIGNYRESPSVMRPIVGGVSPIRLESAQFTTTSPLVASNTLTARSTATFESTAYAKGRLRVGTNISVSKFQVYESGFNATDSMGIFHNWGANSATGDDRTDLTSKEFRFYNYGYTNANPKFLTLWSNGQQTKNRIWFGGGDNAAEAATEFRMYTAAKGQLGGTNHFEIDGSGNVIIPDAARFRFTDLNGNMELTGNGSPEGVQAAPVGSTYRRKNGGASTTFYVKESGTGNTGWVALGPPGAGGVASSRQILTQHSLTGGGDLSTDRTLNLVGDTASPGNNKVYGTDGSGVRGWKNDPAGGGGVSITGTPTSGQIAEWTSASAIQGVTATGSGSPVKATAPTLPSTVTIGAAGGTTGAALFKGTTSGTVTLSVADAAGTYTVKLPNNAPGFDEIPISDAAGQLDWINTDGTGPLTRSFSANVSAWNLDVSTLTDPSFVEPDTDELKFLGTSGNITFLAPQSGVTAYTNKWPAVTGTANQLLKNDGSGQWGWVHPYNIGVAETTVASATTTDLGAVASDKVSITGTTTITGFGTVAAGVKREGRFTGALTLTHNATSLIVPGGASLTTAAGDRFQAYSLGSGNWVVSSYTKADGTAVVGGGGGAVATDAIWDVSGDLAVGTGANTAARLAPPTQLSGSTLYYGPGGVEWVNPATHFIWREDFLAAAMSTEWTALSSGGGSGQQPSEAGAFGQIYIGVSAVNNYRHLAKSGSGTFAFGLGRTVVTWRFKTPTASNGTDRYTVYAGVYDHQTTPVDGVWIEGVDNVNSGNWQIKFANNSTTTTYNTSTAIGTGYTTFTADCNAGATEVKCYINGTLVHTETGSNIPPSTRTSELRIGAVKNLGGNYVQFQIDYVDVYVKY